MSVLVLLLLLEPAFARKNGHRVSSPYHGDVRVTSPRHDEPRARDRRWIPEGTYPVARVIDGETFVVSRGKQNVRVRLIGVDTPETVKRGTPVQPFGPEASARTRELIAQGGNKVRLMGDGARVDRYGRSLAHATVKIGGKDRNVGETLVREGLARAELQYQYSRTMKNLYWDAEQKAKRDRLNLWRV
jgi:micrococcal nuclease